MSLYVYCVFFKRRTKLLQYMALAFELMALLSTLV